MKASNNPLRILIIDAGWVLVGHITYTKTHMIVNNGNVVRNWGTTRGIGQLALSGPTGDTALDPIPRTLVSRDKVIFDLNVTHKTGWWPTKAKRHDIEPDAPRSAKQIFVVEAGWVLEGEPVENVSNIGVQETIVHNGHVIRTWGTEWGLGEIAMEGPKSGTVLDPLGESIIPSARILFNMDITDACIDKWPQ